MAKEKDVTLQELQTTSEELLKQAAEDYAKAQESRKQYNYQIGFIGNNHGFTEQGGNAK